MGNDFLSVGGFSPEAYTAYQQYMQSQQQSQAKGKTANPLQDNGFSLIYDSGYPPQTEQATTTPAQYNNFYQSGNSFWDTQSVFGNGFGGGFSNDIFMSQLYKTKPWENIQTQTSPSETPPAQTPQQTPQQGQNEPITFSF